MMTKDNGKSAWSVLSNSRELRQGDILKNCQVPMLGADYGTADNVLIPLKSADLVILTQSCDLVIRHQDKPAKATMVAMCRVYSLKDYREARPAFTSKMCEEARKGRIEGIHLLPSPVDLGDNQTVLIVNFREIFSLPFAYLEQHAASQEKRQRLESPYLEHFAQGFARFFMRVGLPLNIPPYT